jgi:hypothetical protein
MLRMISKGVKMEIIEVEFEQKVYLMTDSMECESLVLCVVCAEVVPVDEGVSGAYEDGSSVQIVGIRVTDPRFEGLIVSVKDLTCDEYDKIEDRAYELASMASQSDYSGYFH